ncbi:hypothetical protein Tco_0951772 [Tanacetum coccineum]|uniref:Uncharacterized protein n=1 Tax=Tanacetum coccineum TaxID=301880 RepID=A0ABQ5DVU6_9ASTR
MAQHVIPAAQLVPKYHSIRRCNHYVVLQSIPYSPECKIVGQILLDHPLSYALTATADVPAVYLQQFWRTVSKLPVETPDNPFVTPVNIETIEAFMNRVGYQGVIDKVSAFYMKNLAQPWQTMFKVFNRSLTTRTSGHDQTKINIFQMFHVVINRTNVDYAALLWWDLMNNVKQKKEAIQYPRFNKLIIIDLMKKFPEIPQRIEEDYHSIKDDIPLVSVYTTGDARVRGMLIPDEFLTEEIRATHGFKEYETVFLNVDVLMNQPQLVVERDHDDDDSEDRLEPGSQKDNPEHVDDDDKELTDTVPLPTTLHTPNMEFPASIVIFQVCYEGCAALRVYDPEHGMKGVSRLAEKATEYLIESNLKPCIAATIIEDRDAFYLEVPYLVSQEFNAQAPKIIEELFKNYASISKTSYKDDDIHLHHDDHQEDDAPPKGEKRVKRHKAPKRSKSARGFSSKHSTKDSTTYVSKQQQQQEWDAWVDKIVIDKDEVIPKDETPKLITELQDVDKRVPTIYDYERMRATLNDALSNQFKNAEEYAYHLE